MHVCKDCQSAKLVLCQSDGDIVCASCGLVQEAHVIDDTLYGNTKYDEGETCITHYEKLNTSHNNKLTNKKTKDNKELFSKASVCVLGDEFYSLIDDACFLYSSVSHLYKERYNKALCCVCFLYACKKLNTEVEPCRVYGFFGVRMWMHYSKLSILIEHSINNGCNKSMTSKHNSTANNSLLKRMIYECPHLNQQQAWNVINVATQLCEKIQCLISKVKMSKLNACLIYISCSINKYTCVSLAYVSKFYNVSIATLKKHEALIQSILKNGTCTNA